MFTSVERSDPASTWLGPNLESEFGEAGDQYRDIEPILRRLRFIGRGRQRARRRLMCFSNGTTRPDRVS